MKTIITHNGTFHADEVVAIALLLQNNNIYNVDIIRTRDINEVNADFVVDVGGIYDGVKYFDHHQIDGGTKSSAGMLLEFIKTNKGLETNPLLEEFINIVDEQDCGIKFHNTIFHKVINGLNDPVDIYSSVQDDNFKLAINYTREVIRLMLQKNNEFGTLDNITYYCFTRWEQDCYYCGGVGNKTKERYEENTRAKKALEEKQDETIKNAIIDGDIIKFKKGDIFIQTSKLIGKAHISIQWDNGQNCWSIQTVPLVNGEFVSKYKLTPVGDEIFIHKNGFISKTKSGDFHAVMQS